MCEVELECEVAAQSCKLLNGEGLLLSTLVAHLNNALAGSLSAVALNNKLDYTGSGYVNIRNPILNRVNSNVLALNRVGNGVVHGVVTAISVNLNRGSFEVDRRCVLIGLAINGLVTTYQNEHAQHRKQCP